MRLKSIKLAGFKSFVDPTTVPFPSNLSAIVGPNGCGKSNIIDAVRWVMGESSAKHLRGESMADVIFNGSNSRKPVGQASIELVFDNSEGKLGGEYGAFTEISVRRKVTREGLSQYFLNGAKCRRRDITDIFLGTGLGPRSYAIIEQGMISRLIESKPEELRVYVEEAAGISKYKERRRETENRIKRTEENLSRLADIREELDRQLQHLEKQAQAAEKYKEFKQEERQKQAELNVLKWRAHAAESDALKKQTGDIEVALEEQLYRKSSNETATEKLREEHHERQESFNQAQARYYETGAEIARLEQSIQHQQDREQQLARELSEAALALTEIESEISKDSDIRAGYQAELDELLPQLEQLQEKAAISSETLAEYEEKMHAWQAEWDEFNQVSGDARQQAEIEQSRIRHSESVVLKATEKQRILLADIEHIETQFDGDGLAQVREDCALSEQVLADLAEQIESAHSQTESFKDSLGEARQSLQQVNETLAEQKAIVSSLMTLQQSAVAGDSEHLANAGIDNNARLFDVLDVEAGWEAAVENVLGRFLKAIVIAEDIQNMPLEKLRGLVFAREVKASQSLTSGSLQDKVSHSSAFAGYLGLFKTVNTLEEGLQQQSALRGAEMLVTPAGDLLGAEWLSLAGEIDQQENILARKQALETAERQVVELSAKQSQFRNQVETIEAELRQLETTLRELQSSQQQHNREASEHRSRLSALEARQEQLNVRMERTKSDLAESREVVTSENEVLEEARVRWQEAMEAIGEYEQQREHLMQRRDDIRDGLDQYRQQARHDRDQAHHMQLRAESIRNQLTSTEQAIDRLKIQEQRLQERQSLLQASRDENTLPVDELRMTLEGLLERRSGEERSLSGFRDKLAEVDQTMRELERDRSEADNRIQQLRGELQELRMKSQALDIHMSGLDEQLKNDGYNRDAVLNLLPEVADPREWEQALERLASRISRLGAINLAAIDEYRVQSDRKGFLDAQNDDLMEALETLETAIRKIDRETRARFKETFDTVNQGLQNLFPKVFGGGSAYLDLTGDDLLETGVSIMARPPGKKNSTIHLLSGGEKALTAIALIFSIFQLNPAPFCMLDEVDAPLDDANVQRYANLVREMSAQVQFIYITHNKIAMEMADLLMGVTMHEPGCSRMVSVDVDEAAAMVAV